MRLNWLGAWLACACSAVSPLRGKVFSEAPQQLWVCTSKWCRERNAAVPLGAGIALAAGTSVDVRSHSCFGRCAKGPNVAVLARDSSEVVQYHRVDTVEKVVRILHALNVKVDENAAECLELNFAANAALDRGETQLSVLLYSAALNSGHSDQSGVILAGRATARLQLARGHRAELAKYARELSHARLLPSRRIVLAAVAYEEDGRPSMMALAGICVRGLAETLCGDSVHAAVRFEASMALLETRRALRDAAAGAQLLPSYAACWNAQAEALALMGRPHEAREMATIAAALESESGKQPLLVAPTA
ncbi:hypothetical protein M885DRAFT_520297 [Pelagophyceae sp. CCMP2097]|nr:hypothetical protein M885DRAFT_520297 [Pelagophyceae sp. CCMP2097]